MIYLQGHFEIYISFKSVLKEIICFQFSYCCTISQLLVLLKVVNHPSRKVNRQTYCKVRK